MAIFLVSRVFIVVEKVEGKIIVASIDFSRGSFLGRYVELVVNFYESGRRSIARYPGQLAR